MAAKEIYDYVSTVTADVDQTLDVSPQEILVENFSMPGQRAHISAGRSEIRVSISDNAAIYLLLRWPEKSEADAGTIVDFFMDATKGNGIMNSFKLDFTGIDGHTYVVRFAQDLGRDRKLPSRNGVPQMRLKVIGRIAD